MDAAMPRVYVSALTGEGLMRFRPPSGICSRFRPYLPGEILTNARQADAVSRALDYITAALDAMNVGATPDIVLTEAEGGHAGPRRAVRAQRPRGCDQAHIQPLLRGEIARMYPRMTAAETDIKMLDNCCIV